MIIFYPPANPVCNPVIVADMTDSSDQWTTAELSSLVYKYLPSGITMLLSPDVFSCKYNYEIAHNGIPLGSSLKMTLGVAIKMPPSDLISQVSVGFVSSALSPSAMAEAVETIANPAVNIMYAVVVEKISSTSNISRSFIAYSSILQPDSLGVSATLFIKGASIDDTLIRTDLAFHLSKNRTIGDQLSEIAAKVGYIVDYSKATNASLPPVSEILFQPSSFTKILDEICLQNKLIYKIDGKIITILSQTTEPTITNVNKPKFSFSGYAGSLMWAVGVENYANIKFKTPVFDAGLFDKILLFDDSKSGLFAGMQQSIFSTSIASAYDMIIIRYLIIRNDYELCCEVTATNNWILAQMRIDGILENKIYEGYL
ncbi:MAG: hypothetical protein JXN64_06280 [Spirochaetes bacterium]|nr:hypothetical protein [Spirochaetota bacterium]